MSIRQRLYPTVEQSAGLVMHCYHSRFVYNLAVEQHRIWLSRNYPKNKRPPLNNAVRMRHLTEARGAFDWLRAGSSAIQQGALRDFDQALQNWFSNPGHFGKPKYRKRGVNESFIIRDVVVRKLNGKWAQIHVPKVGYVKFKYTRDFAKLASVKSARVTFKAGRWHVSLTCQPDTFQRTETSKNVGLDRGVKNTIATSDGWLTTIPGFSLSEQRRLLALQRQLARQVKGSRRYQATKAKLARMWETLTCRRNDWIEKTTTHLVRTYDLIAVEKLNTKAMTAKPEPRPNERDGFYLPNGAAAKAGLNRAILASCWAMLLKRLTQKANLTPQNSKTSIVEVAAAYTSQTCHSCKHIAPENRDSQTVFKCVNCGHQNHADINAALNILERATIITNAGGQSVRHPHLAATPDGHNSGSTTTLPTNTIGVAA